MQRKAVKPVKITPRLPHPALPGADVRYYLPARPGARSIYRPASGQSVQGRGTVRIRQVLPAGASIYPSSVPSRERGWR